MKPKLQNELTAQSIDDQLTMSLQKICTPLSASTHQYMAFEENDGTFSEISLDLTSGTMIFKKQ